MVKRHTTLPARLVIWGGYDLCIHEQVLVESPVPEGNGWAKHEFVIQPSSDIRFITIEAYYKDPRGELYNGHVLVDGISEFTPTACE